MCFWQRNVDSFLKSNKNLSSYFIKINLLLIAESRAQGKFVAPKTKIPSEALPTPMK